MTAEASTESSSIVHTEPGLTISGTRTTLYSVMNHLKVDWPPALIQHWLLLAEPQMAAALAYIEDRRSGGSQY